MWIKKTGRMRWFDNAHGYGFLIPDDGEGDVMVLGARLRKDGFETIKEGAGVECLAAKDGQGRWKAGRILSVDMSTAVAGPPRIEPVTDWLLATVKWFNPANGYGFVFCPAPWGEVFVHQEDLRRRGIHSLAPDQRVMVRCGHGARGPAVADMRPVDGREHNEMPERAG